jgi:RND family efflux transporter MFP subunit
MEISSRIDPQTRTFVARATVDNQSDALRPGMSFRVSINVEGTARPVVPETALQWGADGAYIWTVADGKAYRATVRIVQRQQGRVLLDANVQEGELIVVEGIQRMREGIDVVYDGQSLAGSLPGSGGDSTTIDRN